MKYLLSTKSRFVRVCLVLFALLLPFFVRPVLESKSYLNEATLLVESNKSDKAVYKYAEAARWRSPINPLAREAFEQLKSLGENSSDPELKAEALRLLHSVDIVSDNLLDGKDISAFRRPGFFGLLSILFFFIWVFLTLRMIHVSSKFSSLSVAYTVLSFCIWLLCLSKA